MRLSSLEIEIRVRSAVGKLDLASNLVDAMGENGAKSLSTAMSDRAELEEVRH